MEDEQKTATLHSSMFHAAISRKCPVIAALLVVVATAIIGGVPLLRAVAAPQQNVIIVGFDGVDGRLTERWMNEGKLPNLARLRAEGTFRPLRPTLPAQTPVSWSTFATGLDPGRTGIFDFLKRDPKTYLPVFAAFDETTEPFLLGSTNRYAGAAIAFAFGAALLWIILRLARVRPMIRNSVAIVFGVVAAGAAFWAVTKFIPITRPGVVNHRAGTPMWEVAAQNGLAAKVVHVPVTFPAKPFEKGHLLAGLGVPDISGRIGKPFYFTSELDFQRGGSNEFSIEVVQLEDNRGVIQTKIVGPPNKLFSEPPYIEQPLTLSVSADRSSLSFQLGEQSFALRAGEWSDWVEFEFPFNPLIKVRGVSRFFLLSVQPEIRLYLSPINFDPRHLPPGFHVSTPTEWAPELAEKYGLYKTIGWAIDTWAISEGFANEKMFWDDMEWTVKQYRKMFREFVAGDEQLFIQCFEFPDRVGHVLWRAVDEQHPAYDPQIAAQWGTGILRSYQLMDEIVGEAMAAAKKKNAALIILSDHGFASFRKAVNYNTWLAQNGYLGLKTGVEAKEKNLEILFDQGQFWENVDWSQTRAYALGLGNVYINVKGREAQGTVNPGSEYDGLKAELKTKLEAMIDPENGAKPVSRVISREEAFRKFDPNLMPDLFVTNNDGYRVSWQTSLGGVQKDLFEPNDKVWSGDHCSVDPEQVKGIFFINRKLTTTRAPYIGDIYPTVLQILQLEPPYELDGEALE